MRVTLDSRTRGYSGRADLWVILGIAIALIVAVVVVLLKLLDQSEKHVATVKEMKVGYSESTWNPRTRDCELSLKRMVEANPDRTDATYEQLNLSLKGIKQIARLRKLETVNFTGSTMKDEWLELLVDLPLKQLNLTATDISNKGLEHVARMTRIRGLTLEELPSMNDESIIILGPLKDLQSLHVRGAKLTARGIKALAAFPVLTDLYISHADANDEYLLALSDLEGLEVLTLDESTLSLAGCSNFKKMKKLRKLFLQGGNIDDKRAAAIARLPNVAAITLAGNPLSDTGLTELEKCPNLVGLDLNECKNITDKGLLHFRRAKPNCKVTHIVGQINYNRSLLSE